MPDEFYRSFVSYLSTQELAVLDHLFGQTGDLSTIEVDIQLTNVQAAQSTAQEIHDAVQGLHHHQLIDILPAGRHGNRLQMTTAGMHLWQTERLPVWEKFIRVSVKLDKQRQLECWQIQSPNALKILDYIEIAQKVGMMSMAKATIKIQPGPPMYGNPGQQCWLQTPFAGHQTDQLALQALRTWWTNLSQLQQYLLIDGK